jgi:2-polyprenyl-6-hydroxyphenyl methylase/3-demethylubiquinone-9 3-methyltransferase
MAHEDYAYNNANKNHASAYLVNLLLSLLSEKYKNILNIGCGKGLLARELLKKGYNTYGTDASEAGISIAKSFYPKTTCQRNCRELPLIPLFLQKLAAILKKAGRVTLIVSTPYRGFLKNISMVLSGILDKHFTVHWEGGHIKF